MQVYAGIDLHANNNYLGVVDANGKRILKKKLPNDPEVILGTLNPLRDRLSGAVVESTFNWYWLVDLLMDEGYQVHLANPSAIQQGATPPVGSVLVLQPFLNLRMIFDMYPGCNPRYSPISRCV